MKIYIVLEDVTGVEYSEIVRKVFSSRKAADYYLSYQKYPQDCTVEEWEVED